MTLLTTTRSVTHTGNGATTVWPYSFNIPDEQSHALILHVIATGVETVVSAPDYTITGLNTGSGNVTYPLVGSPLAATHKLRIERRVPRTQPVTITNQTRYYANVVMAVWDRIVMMLQEVTDDLSRVVRAPVESGLTDLILPSPTAKAVIQWNATADGLETGPTATEVASAQGYAIAAEAAWDSFDDRYLGAKAADPTLDNDGDALLTGALYFNTADNELRVWNGAAWQDVRTSPHTHLMADVTDITAFARTILDDADAATARATLGAQASDADLTDLATNGFASVDDYRAATADKTLKADKVWDAMAEVTLTDAASIAWDMETGIDFTITLGGNRTLANPTNTTVGKKGRIYVTQDGTGSRTLSFGSNFSFFGKIAPTLSTAANAVDVLGYDCRSATEIIITIGTNLGKP